MPHGLATACFAALLIASGAAAQPVAQSGTPVAPVTVIGATPLPGTGVDIDKTPANVQVLSAADLRRAGLPSTVGALADRLASVSINDNLDDPFQPDILYRGFAASPVLGTPQGLAVYQNGVRINEAFGDTVNWDLVPDIAVNRLDVMSANPVYGLNALGGAIALTMKNGFDDAGGDAQVSGGSFGRRGASAEYGANNGTLGAYLAANVLDEAGWREFSPSSLRQVYGDIGLRMDKLTLDLSIAGAGNHLSGESATPVQELAVSRSLVFTNPQQNVDKLAFITLDANYQASPVASIQSIFYVRRFSQSVINGNTTGYVACAEPSLGSLCQPDGSTPLIGAAGRPLPDISDGGARPIGENDRQSTASLSLGVSLQFTSTAAVLGRANHLSLGASLDHATTDFQSSVEVGLIDKALQVLPSGLFVFTPQGGGFTATPVSLGAASTYYGLWATDTFNLTSRLALTASGRYNLAIIDLTDRLGTELSGDNRYGGFNPAIGLAYDLTPAVTLYGGYAQGSRAPDPSEIECSNPLLPCLLPSSLASDPPTLRQVVSHTWEAGLRGRVYGSADGQLTWNAGVFRTNVDDDIYGIATSLSAGYFQNIGGTRRQGLELAARYRAARFDAWASYSYIAATFQSFLILPSPSNPFQDTNGDIHVRPGDILPGIPQSRLKLGADYKLTASWMFGASLAVVGSQYYGGDQSNQLGRLPAYAVLNLYSTLDLTAAVQVFADIDNVLNARYATFGLLGDPTGVGAPGVPANGVPNGPGVDNRFQSPAAPLAVYGGVRLRF
jgi:iron complex outermembrane recepter protein